MGLLSLKGTELAGTSSDFPVGTRAVCQFVHQSEELITCFLKQLQAFQQHARGEVLQRFACSVPNIQAVTDWRGQATAFGKLGAVGVAKFVDRVASFFDAWPEAREPQEVFAAAAGVGESLPCHGRGPGRGSALATSDFVPVDTLPVNISVPSGDRLVRFCVLLGLRHGRFSFHTVTQGPPDGRVVLASTPLGACADGSSWTLRTEGTTTSRAP